ncbi:hypothetical protein FBU30_010448 [Linnemannia zychae]|nr:hypothetical protein FBU30_010448 [Linnemannia zychae]
MTQDDVSLDNLQAFRSVNKNIRPSDTVPVRPDDIIYVDCHTDPVSQKSVVLWEDILQAFNDALQIRHKTRVVPFLRDADLSTLEPRRIAAMPNVVLDVVVDSQLDDITTPLSQLSFTFPTAKRNPVYGSVEEAMENYAHMEKPAPISIARGPQAVLDNDESVPSNKHITDGSPKIIDTTTTNTEPSTVSPPTKRNNPQALGPQSANTEVSKEVHLAQTILIANHGDKDAQVALGDMYHGGLGGVKRDYRAALGWYLEAANQGDAEGQFNVGVLYGLGRGVTQDYSLAAAWFHKAADQGHALAQFNIGLLYDAGHGVKQDYLIAMDWYQKAADQGHAPSLFNIGMLYYEGRGVQQDYSTAMSWYHKAADQGDVVAQYNIGDIYENGRGVQQDYLIALEWYMKAAERGDPDAQIKIGVLYHNGHGVARDHSTAMTWYQKAASQGHPRAQFYIGLLFENGLSVPKDISNAIQWYQKAADHGDEWAKNKLGPRRIVVMPVIDIKVFVEIPLDNVTADLAQAPITLSTVKRNPAYGTVEGAMENNPPQTVLIAIHGDKDAQSILGDLYQGRLEGIKYDYIAAIVDDQQDAESQFKFENPYALSYGTTQGYLSALIWFHKAANQGQTLAQLTTSMFYEEDHGVQQDQFVAVNWYRKATD